MTENNAPVDENTESPTISIGTTRLLLILAVAVAVFLVAAALYLLGYSLPPFPVRYTKLVLLAAVPALIIAFPWVSYIIDWLYKPDIVILVEYEASTDKFGLHFLPSPLFRDMTVDDELHHLEASRPVYLCSSYDLEENHAVGHWRGSASDLELVESRESCREVRGDLEDLAREGLALRTKLSSIVRSSTRNIVNDFIADFESETVYSGDEIQNRIDEALDHLDDPDSPDTPDDDLPDDPDDPDSPLTESDQLEPNTNGNQ